MKFELMISSDEDGFRWISNDIVKDFDLATSKGRIALVAAIQNKMLASAERAARPVPPPKPPTERDLARIAAKGHDCFADENEVVVQHGNSIYTHCAICGDVISAG